MAGIRGIINIEPNKTPASKRVAAKLAAGFRQAGYEIAEEFSDKARLTVCVGGDGSLLNMLAKHGFPDIPVAGINTGHLGFFQDVSARGIENFIENYINVNYSVQRLKTVYAEVEFSGAYDVPHHERLIGLNEIVIRGASSHLAHLNIDIGDTFIESFCGDGILVASPAGSTAYNYSLGGSIVDPRLDLLQVTPIAAINSAAYRSFTSSILLPPDQSIGVFPEYPKSKELLLTVDGIEHAYTFISKIQLGFTGDVVKLLRFGDYGFWKTASDKLL